MRDPFDDPLFDDFLRAQEVLREQEERLRVDRVLGEVERSVEESALEAARHQQEYIEMTSCIEAVERAARETHDLIAPTLGGIMEAQRELRTFEALEAERAAHHRTLSDLWRSASPLSEVPRPTSMVAIDELDRGLRLHWQAERRQEARDEESLEVRKTTLEYAKSGDDRGRRAEKRAERAEEIAVDLRADVARLTTGARRSSRLAWLALGVAATTLLVAIATLAVMVLS